jgi:hypothetical protein
VHDSLAKQHHSPTINMVPKAKGRSWLSLSSIPKRLEVNPAYAWLLVFLPALGYFLSTRLTGVWSELGESTTTNVLLRLGNESQNACFVLAEAFDLLSSCTQSDETPSSPTFVELKHPLRLVQDSGLHGVVDLLWRHDSELGRGYLLISESSRRGRVWRWEVGGGPIAIGKTLHVDHSGCRSNLYKNCSGNNGGDSSSGGADDAVLVGSGAMAIDFYRSGNPSTHSSEGHLIVAEWGEGRIVRLEENGARTPLLLHIPAICKVCSVVNDGSSTEQQSTECSTRLPNIERMVLTPMGDLIVAVNYNEHDGKEDAPECVVPSDDVEHEPRRPAESASASLIQLSQAVHIEPIASLHESRKAHAWTSIQRNHSIRRILHSDPTVLQIGGMAIGPTLSLYMTAMIQTGDTADTSIVILELPLTHEEEDDDDDDSEDSKDPRDKPLQPRVLFDMGMYAPGSQKPGSLVVSKSGKMFVSVQDGILVLSQNLGVVGKIVVPSIPTALCMGDDGYLYVASSTRLYRIRTRERHASTATSLVKAPPKRKKTDSI